MVQDNSTYTQHKQTRITICLFAYTSEYNNAWHPPFRRQHVLTAEAQGAAVVLTSVSLLLGSSSTVTDTCALLMGLVTEGSQDPSSMNGYAAGEADTFRTHTGRHAWCHVASHGHGGVLACNTHNQLLSACFEAPTYMYFTSD